jgi:peptide-methionine (S)-S-oxide reductase
LCLTENTLIRIRNDLKSITILIRIRNDLQYNLLNSWILWIFCHCEHSIMGQGQGKPMPTKDNALPGREEKMIVSNIHFVLGNNTVPPFDENLQTCIFGTGCFWGTEKGFWRMPGVVSTSVGYCGGFTKNPVYKEVCSGGTGHNEVVQVVWDPNQIDFVDILRQFWQSHDPTQGMGQGNDRGTQYRSGIYPTTKEQKDIAEKSMVAYQEALSGTGKIITTEIVEEGSAVFYYAEDYHQQYLAKPGSNQYCSAQPLEISLPPIEGTQPLLPEKYWEKHAPTQHCVLRQSNKQISLSSL